MAGMPARGRTSVLRAMHSEESSMFMNLSPGAISIRASLPEAIRLASAHGFGGVDISIAEAAQIASQSSVDAVRELFATAGVRPGGWGLPVNWRGNETEYQEGLSNLGRLAALGQAIGATRVTQWIPSASDERAFYENFHFHVARFQPIARILADHGCRLALEFIGPQTQRNGKKYGFIHTMDGMLALCAAIGPNVGLLLDSWHWYTSHSTLAELDHVTNDQIVYVHVNDAPAGVAIDDQIDNVRCLPGETGVIDLPGFLRKLEAAGYDGPVTPEPFSQRVREMPAEDAARTTATALRGAWRAAGLRE